MIRVPKSIFRGILFIESFLVDIYSRSRSLFDTTWRDEFTERSSKDIESVACVSDTVWFHAASVGEVNGIAPLINRFKKEKDSIDILVTTTSATGKARAVFLWPESRVRLLPLDSKSSVRKFLAFFRPKLLVINETELWPRVLHEVHGAEIPVFLVNGRISDRTYPRYKFFKLFFSVLLKKITMIFAQSEIDKSRFIDMGADSDAVKVYGSTKYDILDDGAVIDPFLVKWKKSKADGFIFTAGSVREEEEDILLAVYTFLKNKYENFRMILAPRHPERYEALSLKIKSAGISSTRKSFSNSLSMHEAVNDLILLDTFGDLSSAYSLSNLSFVGGTLCPVGGHNILEPPMYHCPVIVGPFVMNVRAAVELLKKQEAYLEVKGEEELRDLIASLLENRSVLNELAEKSFHAACSARGVTELVYSEINKYI